MNMLDDVARHHHYVFAHKWLPDMLEFPGRLAEVVEEGRFSQTLRDIWDQLGSELRPEDRLSGEGIDAVMVDLGPAPGVLITLPPAQHWNEAYAVVIAPLDPRGERRFFTLERQLADGSEDPGTMLCEWSRSDEGISHGNFGYGPEGSDHDAFVSRVGGLMAGPGRDPA